VGEEELARGAVVIRDMGAGEQKEVPLEEAAGYLLGKSDQNQRYSQGGENGNA